MFVSSFFANRLNHCRNFSIQANVRRRVFQLEHRNRRQFKEAVGLTVVTYTSFFTSRFSSVTFSNCFLASDPHFYARRMGLSASVLFQKFMHLKATTNIISRVQFSRTMSPLICCSEISYLSNSICHISLKSSALIVDIVPSNHKVSPKDHSFKLKVQFLSLCKINTMLPTELPAAQGEQC